MFSAIYIFVAHLDWSYCDQEQESWENNRIKWWVFKSSGTNRTNLCPCYVRVWSIFVACLSNCRSTWQINLLKHKRNVNAYLNKYKLSSALSTCTGNPQLHTSSLRKAASKACTGEPSLQNAMEVAIQSLR